jgi:hypothetical protein
MSFIIAFRNPGNKKLDVLLDENDRILEYPTEEEADAIAEKIPACVAWGYSLLEVTDS